MPGSFGASQKNVSMAFSPARSRKRRFNQTLRLVERLAGRPRIARKASPPTYPSSVSMLTPSGQDHWSTQEAIAREGYTPPS